MLYNAVMTPLLSVSPEVQERYPDYRGLVIIASGLTNGPSDDTNRV